MRDVIAAMRVGQKGLRAIRRPFHRAFHLARGPQANDFFRINENLRAETAADIGRDDAQFVFRRHADKCGDDQPRDMRILRRVPQREIVGALVIFRERRARLHGIRHQAIVDDIELGDVLGGGESRGGGLLDRQDATGRSCCWRCRRWICGAPGACALAGSTTAVQHVVVDLDLLGGVAALRHSLGDHHRHRIADAVRPCRRPAPDAATSSSA